MESDHGRPRSWRSVQCESRHGSLKKPRRCASLWRYFFCQDWWLRDIGDVPPPRHPSQRLDSGGSGRRPDSPDNGKAEMAMEGNLTRGTPTPLHATCKTSISSREDLRRSLFPLQSTLGPRRCFRHRHIQRNNLLSRSVLVQAARKATKTRSSSLGRNGAR